MNASCVPQEMKTSYFPFLSLLPIETRSYTISLCALVGKDGDYFHAAHTYNQTEVFCVKF